MKTENIGCLGWLSIIGYALVGFGFLIYAFSDENEVFGYLDWSFLIIGIIVPIFIVSRLYEFKRITSLFKFTIQVIFLISLISVIGIAVKLFKDGFGNMEDSMIATITSVISLIISGLIYFYFNVKRRIMLRREKINKKIEVQKLITEAKSNVINNNKNFIKKLQNVHGNRFGYRDVILEKFDGIEPDNTVKILQNHSVTLLCRKHDVKFEERVSNVFKTSGCERCKIENSYNSAKKEKVEEAYMSSQEYFSLFKDRLNKIFNNKYDFSEVNYRGINNKVSVICPHHGTFITLPKNLFKGTGCPVCASERNPSEKIYKEVKNEVNISPEEYDDLMKLINQMSIDIKGIKKDGKETKRTIFKIDKNINALLGIEKIKTNCKNDQEEECIEQILTLIEKNVDFKDSNKYEKNVKAWFDFWYKLESLSKDFMSQSEFLYSSIEPSNFKDYSPFVLYSCRALEYELLQKVFIAYHNYIDKKYSDKDLLFNYNSDELDSSTIKDIESGQMSYFKRKFKSPKYTLGDMRLILNLLPNKDKPKGSKRYQALLALQELNIFINEKIGKIPSNLIKTIEKIINDYRNPSAHVEVLDKRKADLFKRDYKKLMNDLIGIFS